MKILAIETSAKSVSAAVVENGVPLASAYQNMGLTHSRTLMPLVDGMLSAAGLRVQDMDLLAAANGPGSFTGLRIGVSALKGLAWALEKPCCGVSTLAAMARNLAHMEGLIICAMDARRSQVYNALFLAHDGVLTRQCPDRAIGLAELAEEIKNRPEPKFVVGDGAGLCYNYLLEQDVPASAGDAERRGGGPGGGGNGCRRTGHHGPGPGSRVPAAEPGGAGAAGPGPEDHLGLIILYIKEKHHV